MPLPTTSVPWPPKQLEHVTPILNTWSAWWTGDPGELTTIYRNRNGASLPTDRPAQHRGGVVGRLARFWWGRPTGDPTQQHDQTHVPLAADIARTSADLLFAEPPEIAVPDRTTQGYVDETLTDPLFATLTGAAEQGAALGGTYLRVTFDRTVADRAFVTAIPADEAWPEFAWGSRLRAVTFWHVVGRDGQAVWRHLERHELDTTGIGVVQHGLYQGTPDHLGRPVPLADRPETAPLAGSVDADGYVVDGRTPGLNVVYVPNSDPATARAFRRIPAASGLGTSDLDGVEPLLDNLDEAHASWLRDLRLGKARLLVARYMLDDLGAGQGAAFNMDAEVFTPLKMAASEDGDAPVTAVQFKIRFDEHLATVQHWTDQVIRGAGYSTQTFGEQADGAQQTATEVVARENRSMLTRGRKLRMWSPALTELLTKLLTVDADVFGRPHNPDGLRTVFPDGVNESPLQTAQTALALYASQAASTRTLVALVHPDWDDVRVDEEAGRILAERGQPVGDPFALR